MLRAIHRRVQVQVVIPHGVAADTRDILPQTRDDWGSRGSGRPVIGDPRVTPRRRGVPQVLDRWTVVGVQSEHQFLATQRGLVRVPDVCIVDAEMVILYVVSDLNETANMGCPGAGQEQGDVLRKFNAAVLSSRNRRLCRGK